jgi:hypothetical protein
VKEIKKLNCMSSHCDGAHCGLTDWYPEIEQGIQTALKRGPKARWTTGWYASKKEIASACITHTAEGICIEVGVSDDFDTEGLGEVTIPHTTSLRKVQDAIFQAWELAEENQKDNRLYVGFSIHNRKGAWVETLIQPMGDGHWLDRPPGDNYHKWGWQGDGARIPSKVKEQLEAWADGWNFDHEGKSFTVGSWTIKPWE